MNTEQLGRNYDVAIVGGGAAGLSAALTLARGRREVLVLDAGTPRNAPATAAHGLLGLEGINPMQLLERGRREAASYGAHIVEASVTGAAKIDDGEFVIRLDDGSSVQTGQLVLATGVRDELPDVPGLAQRWGRDAVHCPYCHGWEIRDQRIGVVATGPMSIMKALLFRQWSEYMWFLPNGIDFAADQLEQLTEKGIIVVPGDVSRVEVTDDHLTGVMLDKTTTLALDALAVPTTTSPRLAGLHDLGLETSENAAGVSVVADATGHTSVPGVWAAGNLVNPGMQVSEAAANGARVAMMLNTELIFGPIDQAMMAGSSKQSA